MLKKLSFRSGRAVALGLLLVLTSFFSVVVLLAQSGYTYLPVVVGGAESGPAMPPAAVDDAYVATLNTPLVVGATGGVLANDTNPSGGSLQAVLVSGVAHGDLDLGSDGSFTYTPASGYTGPDSFTYRAVAGAAASEPATVRLTVRLTNRAPVAADDAYETDEDTGLDVAAAGVLANDTDADADPLRAELASGPAHGDLMLSTNGAFTYAPDPGYIGPDSFTYVASDGTLSSEPAAVTLTVNAKNDPPRIVSGAPAFSSRLIGEDVLRTHIALGADLDNDGDMDIVATDYENGRMLWYENQNGEFTERLLDGAVEGAYPASVGDVDGDGDMDVMAAGYLADTFVWYRNDGGGILTRIDIDTASDGAHSIITVDLDGDGDSDLVTSSQDGGVIAWYENDGAENFARRIVDDDALEAKRAEVADMDGDSDLDIVTAEYKRDIIAWLENDGAQNFTKHVISVDADGAYYAYPADLDGDDDMDVLSASKLDGTIAWYRNDGGGVFTFMPLYTAARGARTAIAADLDGDGDMDVLSAALNTNTVAWFENDGGGTFTRRPIDATVRGAYGVFAADMDLDGDLDVLSAGRNSNEVRLHSQYRGHEVTVKQKQSLVIDATRLRAEDPDDGPMELTYTLTNAPARGELRLGDVVLAQGDTFTQDDVNNGRLVYAHTGADRTADTFAFVVADGGEDGALVDVGSFTIKIGR